MKQINHILKNAIRFTSCVLLFISTLHINAQTTVAIPDANFRAKLMSSYPSVMTGNQLNIAAAKNFTSDLIFTYSNISDLTGIQYFTSVFKIDASNNNLTTIPDISATTSLQYLFLNNNKLTQLPNLSTLVNLLQLQAFNNKLTSLPALNNLKSLDQLYITTNSLTSFPDISNLTQIRYLIIGDNPFGSLPDFSPNTNLLELHVHETNISEIKGLASLTKLTRLYCWQNNISDLSALSGNTTLIGFYAFSNNLSALPTLTNKPNLNDVEVANNKLTFEDLLPLTTMPNVVSGIFSYSPQDSVGVYTPETIRLRHPITLAMTEDAGVASNKYVWHKDSTIVNASTGTLRVASAQASDSGAYFVTITNPSLPNLTLTHRLWRITTTDCVNITSLSFSVPANECGAGATISSTITMNGGTQPYRYLLTPFSTTDTIRSTTGNFTQIAPGKYSYHIVDANNCGMDTTVTIDRPLKCDPVITPNGDPQMSSYFIEQSGTAKIIDLGGNTIIQMNTPAVWYGTRADGSITEAGYYVIILNNKKLTNITVIR